MYYVLSNCLFQVEAHTIIYQWDFSNGLQGWEAYPNNAEYYLLISGPISKSIEIFNKLDEDWQALGADRVELINKPGTSMAIKLKGPQKIRIVYDP